jgi:predicted Fe-Mo cluster-binding NifX family protein
MTVSVDIGYLARMLLLPRLMKMALPVWNGRVSPVLDVARRLRVVEVDDGIVAGESEHLLVDRGVAEALSELGVDILICAAISRPLEATVWVAGVKVISEVCGPADEVVAAYLQGDTALAAFAAPGRCVRRHDAGRPLGRYRPSPVGAELAAGASRTHERRQKGT